MSDERDRILLKIARRLLEGARYAAIRSGVLPPHWVEVLAIELVACIICNPEKEKCLEVTIETIRTLYELGIDEGPAAIENGLDSNPRIDDEDETTMADKFFRVIRISSEGPPTDVVDDLLTRTIGKVQR